MQRAVIIVAVLLLAGGAGCQGKSDADAPKTAKAAAPDHKYDAAPAKADTKTEAPPAADGGEAKAPADGKAGPALDPALGQRFADPPWYRKTLFPDATSVKDSRTKADPDTGLFTSSMLFQLPSSMTPEGCADHLQSKVGGAVANLERKQLDDGRFELRGTTDRYEVTMQCGAPKGQLVAYVSYRWTS